MENLHPRPPHNTRIGFHYYPDTLHYRESDLNAWLPELRALGASWVTLSGSLDYAIPENFVRGLLTAGIEPIIHLTPPVYPTHPVEEVRLLFHTYARWGVHYVALYDRPNTCPAWGSAAWAQSNLVERFLDVYLPVAEACLKAGLTPVFPPLEPGGDYWDTSFLRVALQNMLRRGHTELLNALVLGAYAWFDNTSLNYGAGGPERWPDTRPYDTPPGSEDQRGFRIFDWYQAIAQAVLGKSLPIILLRAGYSGQVPQSIDPDLTRNDGLTHAHKHLSAASLLASPGNDVLSRQQGSREVENLEAIAPEVLACNFWLLAAGKNSQHAPQAWFSTTGQTLPVVGALRQWVAQQGLQAAAPLLPVMPAASAPVPPAPVPPTPPFVSHPEVPVAPAPAACTPPAVKPPAPIYTSLATQVAKPAAPAVPPFTAPPSLPATGISAENAADTVPTTLVTGATVVCATKPQETAPSTPLASRPIAHYLLLPSYEWGISDWHLEVIRPFVKRHRPTVGFSVEEAANARQVTVIGGVPTFSPQVIAGLRASGCLVRQINGDGTTIASQLADL